MGWWDFCARSLFFALSFYFSLFAPAAIARDTTVCKPGFAELAKDAQPARLLPPAAEIRVPADPKADYAAFTKRDTLKVVTYNVENLFLHVGSFKPVPATGERVQVKPEMEKPAEKRAGVAKTILEMSPDVAVLQEVEEGSVIEFCKNDLKGQYKPVFLRGNDGRGIDVAVIVKAGLPLEFVYESHKNEPMSNPLHPRSDKVFSRDLTTLTARVPGHDTPLFVLMGTHAKSKRTDSVSDPESNSIREAQSQRSAEFVRFYRDKYPGVPVMMAADFNAEVNTAPEYESLRQSGMKDCFDVTRGERIPIGDLRRVTHTYHPKGGDTQKSQLDAIMISPEGWELVVASRVRRYKDPKTGEDLPPADTWEQRKRQPSDHCAVEVELDLREMLKLAGIAERE